MTSPVSSTPGARPGFSEVAQGDVVKLITDYPFAWVTSVSENGPLATAIPVRPVLDEGGALIALQGHFARSNPQIEALRSNNQALFQFTGPHGYISPSWYEDRSQAPTWNFVTVQISAQVELLSSNHDLRAIIDDLAGHLEQNNERPWSALELGERYDRLARGIVAFRARNLVVRPKFKLSQDEPDHVYKDILKGLRGKAQTALSAWVRRYNKDRDD